MLVLNPALLPFPSDNSSILAPSPVFRSQLPLSALEATAPITVLRHVETPDLGMLFWEGRSSPFNSFANRWVLQVVPIVCIRLN